MKNNKKSWYRPDIDGLRALAIIPVVLFHAGIAGFSGGFVGVDIFFVISGFLITSIIHREVQTGNFSFWNFYRRRVLRLLPALTVVLLATSVAVHALLVFPGQIQSYGVSLIAQSFFLSNLFFFTRDSYFADTAENLPLLHTWSLSVEEQFYVIFPILFLVLYRFKKHIAGIITITIASFLLCIYLSNVIPNEYFTVPFIPDFVWGNAQNSAAAFFLSPARAWELTFGSLLALVLTSLKVPSRITNNANSIATLGLVMIVAAIVFLDDSSAFPGYAALLPTVGTVAIIFAGHTGTPLVNKLLSLKPFIWVGLLSYSLYLWHWPIFVLYNTAFPGGTIVETFGLIILTFVAAYLTFTLVEQPFRTRSYTASNRVIVLTGLAILLAFALLGYYLKSSPKMTDEQLPAYVHELVQDEQEYLPRHCLGHPEREDCALGEDIPEPSFRFVLWGDSHAEVLYPELNKIAQELNAHGDYFAESNCIPLMGASTNIRNTRCTEIQNAAFAHTLEQDIDVVVLGARWNQYIHGKNTNDNGLMLTDPATNTINAEEASALLKKQLRVALEEWHKAGVRVIFFRQTPLQENFNLKETFYASLANGRLVDIVPTQRSKYEMRREDITEILNELDTDTLKIVDPIDIFCTDTSCMIVNDDQLLYRDNSHLNKTGSSLLFNDLKEAMVSASIK